MAADTKARTAMTAQGPLAIDHTAGCGQPARQGTQAEVDPLILQGGGLSGRAFGSDSLSYLVQFTAELD